MKPGEYPILQPSDAYEKDVLGYMYSLDIAYDAVRSVLDLSREAGDETDPQILHENLETLAMLSMDTQREETIILNSVIDHNLNTINQFTEKYNTILVPENIMDIDNFLRKWQIVQVAVGKLILANTIIHEMALSDEVLTAQDNERYLRLGEQVNIIGSAFAATIV